MRHLGADALPAAVLLRFVKFVQFHRNVARPSYRMCLFPAVPRIRPIECVQFPTVPRVHLIESFNVLAMPRALFIECTFFCLLQCCASVYVGMYPRGRKAKLAADKARIYKATGRTLIVLYIHLSAQSLQLYSALLGSRLIPVGFICATLQPLSSLQRFCYFFSRVTKPYKNQ